MNGKTQGGTMPEFQPVMDVAALEAFFAAHFPQIADDGRIYRFLSVQPGIVCLQFAPTEKNLRPGSTISGPTLFALADYAAYGAILAHIGPVALAVTTGASIDFLRKPSLGLLVAEAKLLKLGKRLAVIAIAISDELGALVAHSTMTYSIPPG
jgi:uncharacterized protein (TIGR00369 family)